MKEIEDKAMLPDVRELLIEKFVGREEENEDLKFELKFLLQRERPSVVEDVSVTTKSQRATSIAMEIHDAATPREVHKLLIERFVGREEENKALKSKIKELYDRFLPRELLEKYGFLPVDPMVVEDVSICARNKSFNRKLKERVILRCVPCNAHRDLSFVNYNRRVSIKSNRAKNESGTKEYFCGESAFVDTPRLLPDKCTINQLLREDTVIEVFDDETSDTPCPASNVSGLLDWHYDPEFAAKVSASNSPGGGWTCSIILEKHIDDFEKYIDYFDCNDNFGNLMLDVEIKFEGGMKLGPLSEGFSYENPCDVESLDDIRNGFDGEVVDISIQTYWLPSYGVKPGYY
ncbi:unnamed protein product [Pseudo-nitzschia multistriata]|uniref:Uncharacterized protein n=1 Tax=Pseudo-nitzschia multistriata TaxID=183589 RepID=A0A448Z0Y5_9STRA|nr:unnamed protein product [Pseudo-nitzschia multistriata]